MRISLAGREVKVLGTMNDKNTEKRKEYKREF